MCLLVLCVWILSVVCMPVAKRGGLEALRGHTAASLRRSGGGGMGVFADVSIRKRGSEISVGVSQPAVRLAKSPL